ncbi:hypothetical protein PoB_004719000 [Plakobranchus ocellatus]|uniref:Uncharacterized protein n=1 Tax=Plakobranchus ocellatus TaxID=259542 RepID=A0AAV4BNK9_9GAST|nr:hypothetical protein PoB_004719000 [Plakobranchus ocellatus]
MKQSETSYRHPSLAVVKSAQEPRRFNAKHIFSPLYREASMTNLRDTDVEKRRILFSKLVKTAQYETVVSVRALISTGNICLGFKPDGSLRPNGFQNTLRS